MSDTRGETIRHNMQKKHLIFVNMSKIELAPGGGVCYTCEDEKNESGCLCSPEKQKKITIRCLVLRRAVVGALPDKRGKHNMKLILNLPALRHSALRGVCHLCCRCHPGQRVRVMLLLAARALGWSN